MKQILILATIIAFSKNIVAQDTIIKRDGDTLQVKIVRSTPDMVDFTYPNEELINSEYKNSLSKIIYAGGRIEHCSGATKLAEVKGKEDWEKVEITSNSDDVRGLTKLGEVVGKSNWGGGATQGLGNKEAHKKLKQHAAKLGGSIVLLQEKSDVWGVKLIGVAYK